MSTHPVAVVTGASRGAGRGIAVALGSHGCTVYVTGRTDKPGGSPLPGTIYETAEAVSAAGGKGIAMRVDHSDDAQVQTLFEEIRQAEGRVDILVNNACALHDDLTKPENFWEKPLEMVDILNVGLRSQYVATYYAAPLLLKSRHGLVMFTSSPGSVCYMHGPAYGAQKAGVDKFAADMAVDFKESGVAALSIWMGILLTERTKVALANDPDRYGPLAEMAETPELTGHVIWALYSDPRILERSGQTVITAEEAMHYGIKDAGGKQPGSHRAMLGDPRIPHPAIVR